MASLEDSTLPFEIIELILTKVPAKSLHRFKLTCRRWFELFQEEKFIYKNIDLNLNNQHFIRITNMVEIINPTTKARSCLPLPDKFPNRTDFYELNHVIQCDGLLLCSLRGFNLPSKVVVWNPFLNQVRCILNTSNDTYHIYGFGYDSVSRDNYKILKFYNMSTNFDGIRTDYSRAEIYEFKSNSWRTLDVSLAEFTDNVYATGVSVKGNMYWVSDPDYCYVIYIHSFDFSTEDFKPMCHTPILDADTSDTVFLSAFGEDKLSLIHKFTKNYQTRKIEVWITNSVKDKVLKWTKLFALSGPVLQKLRLDAYCQPRRRLLYFIDRNNKLNVVCHQKLSKKKKNCICVNLYVIGEDGLIIKKEIDRYSLENEWIGYMYFSSLVCVPQTEDWRLSQRTNHTGGW